MHALSHSTVTGDGCCDGIGGPTASPGMQCQHAWVSSCIPFRTSTPHPSMRPGMRGGVRLLTPHTPTPPNWAQTGLKLLDVLHGTHTPRRYDVRTCGPYAGHDGSKISLRVCGVHCPDIDSRLVS
jgi:hypothetical protein